MRAFQLIEVKADTPLERGRQYGEQARGKIRAGIEDYRRLFAETSSMSWETIKKYALTYLSMIKRIFPDMMEEAQGIALGAKVGIDEIMVLNCRYEITKFPHPNECTSFAVLPEASAGQKTYLGQNWDYRAGIIDNVVLVRLEESDGTRILGLAEAGQLIRNGFNNHGIGLCANNLQSIYDSRGVGIPVTFLRRKALSCRSFAEAGKLIINAERAVSCNFMLAASEGQAVNLETYPGGVDLIEPFHGIIAHANHFVVQPEIHALEVSPRGDRLDQLLREKHGTLNVAMLSECLSDHQNYPQAICRHPSDVGIRWGRRGITVAGVIYDLAESTAYVCAGPPCAGEFIAYQL